MDPVFVPASVTAPASALEQASTLSLASALSLASVPAGPQASASQLIRVRNHGSAAALVWVPLLAWNQVLASASRRLRIPALASLQVRESAQALPCVLASVPTSNLQALTQPVPLAVKRAPAVTSPLALASQLAVAGLLAVVVLLAPSRRSVSAHRRMKHQPHLARTLHVQACAVASHPCFGPDAWVLSTLMCWRSLQHRQRIDRSRRVHRKLRTVVAGRGHRPSILRHV